MNKYLYKDEKEYEKDILKKEYDNFILDNYLNKEKFEKIIYEIINNQNEMNEKEYVNIDSPLFGIISKTKDFDKNYIIYISQKNIDEYNLKDNYIIRFNNLNNSKGEYRSIKYAFNEEIKLYYLKELNINFNNIRQLKLSYNGNEEINKECNILNLFQNLEILTLKGNNNIIKLLENVNFKELKELYLSSNDISDIKVLEKVKFDKLEKIRFK